MRWPWSKKVDPADIDEARAHLAQVHERDAEVRRVVAQTEKVIRRNHFGPRIAAALREPK